MALTAQSPIGTISTWLPVAVLCIGVNVALGTIVNLVKAPIYLDAAGTIAFALLVYWTGWRGFVWAAAVGALSFVISGLLFNPVLFWFVPTQIAIAAYGYFVAGPVIGDRLAEPRLRVGTYARIVVLGLGLGVVAGIVSAPIIAMVFGGITGAGASVITAVLLKAGETLFTSVLASGLASEPLDKLIQLALAVAIVRITPGRVRLALRGK
jgi:energy-coupling factor transport system substrate-specific component